MSDETWIVNASPLICLAKVGQLELLVAETRKVLIPVIRAALRKAFDEVWEP